MSLPPGAYSARFAAVDRDGRRGVVVRPLELPAIAGDALATSDLIVGALPAGGQTLTPSLEPHVDGKLAAYLELYATNAGQDRVTVTLEIAEGEASPALTSASLNISAGAKADWRVASGAVDAALLPGRYVARAAVRRDGVAVRTVSRPFVVDRSGTTIGAVVRASYGRANRPDAVATRREGADSRLRQRIRPGAGERGRTGRL
jgi:hypothetical protein